MEERKYYVYVHIGKKSGAIRYIGKGKENRYKEGNRNCLYSVFLEEEGDFERVIILNHLSENRALEIESALLLYYGIDKEWCNLANLSSELNLFDYNIINAENIVNLLELPKPVEEKLFPENFEEHNYFKNLSKINNNRVGIKYNFIKNEFWCDCVFLKEKDVKIKTNRYKNVENVEKEVDLMIKLKDFYNGNEFEYRKLMKIIVEGYDKKLEGLDINKLL
jgi:hypothetical protein